MLKQRYPRQNGLLDTSYLRDRKTWLSVPDEFVQILCVNDCHWACVSNVFSEQGSVDLYDSLHTIPTASGSIAQQVCTILKSQQHSVTINVVNVQKQIGCNDCGLYAIAMAADLCSRIDPFKSSYDQSSMRIHLKECFESEPPTLTVFSTRRDSKEKRRLVHRKSVELFCLCRRTEVLPMASCDTCNMWYHEGCVPIPDDVLLDEDDSILWICCQCSGCTVSDEHTTCSKSASLGYLTEQQEASTSLSATTMSDGEDDVSGIEVKESKRTPRRGDTPAPKIVGVKATADKTRSTSTSTPAPKIVGVNATADKTRSTSTSTKGITEPKRTLRRRCQAMPKAAGTLGVKEPNMTIGRGGTPAPKTVGVKGSLPSPIPATLDETRGVTSVKSVKEPKRTLRRAVPKAVGTLGVKSTLDETRGVTSVKSIKEPKRTLRRAVPKAVGTLGVKSTSAETTTNGTDLTSAKGSKRPAPKVEDTLGVKRGFKMKLRGESKPASKPVPKAVSTLEVKAASDETISAVHGIKEPKKSVDEGKKCGFRLYEVTRSVW
ncbi:uncharacterized protein LOC135351311 isoform X3 [Halichondria panicea]|uniref:uncharacterized protein LOC135351311 isoform X3 n=1 Tax=Halichondria panicea TaxID=6063 RepID=UPI00312B6CDB